MGGMWGWDLDERGEGLRGGVSVSRRRLATLAPVLADKGAVLVHARCNVMHTQRYTHTIY